MKFKHTFIEKYRCVSSLLYQSENINAAIGFITPRCINVVIYKGADTEADGYETHNIEKRLHGTCVGGLDGVELKINTENFLLSFYKDGKRLFADRAPLAYNFENEFGSGVYHYITREKGEKIYGLGDKGGALNKAGRSFKIETTDSMGYDGATSDPLYKHVPFYICENSVGCYGIFYDTASTATIDLGREHNNYYEPYKFFHSEDSVLNYYVFFGTKLQILQEFCRLVGEQAFPPKWSFDYCGSTMAYTDAPDAYQQMRGFLDKLQQYDLSCKGFYLSSGYTSIGNQRCVFNWNYDKFPDPEQFIREFREAGIELIPNIKPSFLVTHPMYEMLAKKGWFIKNPDGTPFVTQLWDNLGSYLDFTNPDAFAFWKQQVTEKLLDLGMRATWNDNNEFDIRDIDAVTSDGRQACRLRPELTYLMDLASFEAQTEKRPELRPFLSTRSGGIAVRRLAQTWSGDNYTSFKDLRYCHYIGLTMSLSGFFFYGHDLGGFAGEMPSRELLMRWLQHGLLEPRFTIHSWNADGSATMPWSYEDLMPSVRAVFAQRKQLIPYFYQCAYEAVTEELPLNAPLFLYYDDTACEAYPDSMLLGRDILAAFVFDEGETQATAYLPQGDGWYLDGEYYDGGQAVTYSLPYDGAMRYFVRAGSVLPTDEAPYGYQSGEQLMINIYAKDIGHFEKELFFDDGLTYAYRDGHCTKLLVSVDCNESDVTVTVKQSGDIPLTYTMNIVDFKKRTKFFK